MKYINYLALLTIVLTFVMCDKKAKDTTFVPVQKSIVIYGSSGCPHCKDFIFKMDSVGLEYTFNDIDKSDKHYTDMANIIKAANITGRVDYPIVIVQDTMIMIAPEISKVIDAL